jgi:hypothetical protein
MGWFSKIGTWLTGAKDPAKERPTEPEATSLVTGAPVQQPTAPGPVLSADRIAQLLEKKAL